MRKHRTTMTHCTLAVIVIALGAWAHVFAEGDATVAALPPPESEAFQPDLAWSPDGRWIAFSEHTSEGESRSDRWAIHIIGADGAGRRLLMDNAQFVSWSPDGKKLAFGALRDGDWNIYTANTDGTGLTRLTDSKGKNQHPAWSPKGDRIAFSSDRDGSRAIYVMAPDGSQMVRLTNTPAKDYNPSWSPDGSRLVFFREKGDHKDQIYVLTADGAKESPVTQDDANHIFPSFLPDGRIAFTSHKEGAPKSLVCVAPDGSSPQTISGVTGFFARWSPDGRRIAFVSGAWPRTAIYLTNADGTNVRKLVN